MESGEMRPSKRVAVIMQRRAVQNRWQSEVWEALGVLADYDAPGEARVIVEQAGATQWLYPGFEMVLHRSESEGYYHNVSTQEPRVFVMWRMEQERAVPQFVTVSYDEASRWMDGGEQRSEEHTSELQSLAYLVCRLLLEKKKKKRIELARSTVL